jgi:hypothetical protein
MKDFFLNIPQFDLVQINLNKISIALYMVKTVIGVGLHYLLKLSCKLKDQKIHSTKMMGF